MTDHTPEERAAFARWLADTHAPALRRMDADGAHAAGFAAGVAAERERCAKVCEDLIRDDLGYGASPEDVRAKECADAIRGA